MAYGPFVLDEELIETRDAEVVVTARHLEYETGGEVDIAVFAIGRNRQPAHRDPAQGVGKCAACGRLVATGSRIFPLY